MNDSERIEIVMGSDARSIGKAIRAVGKNAGLTVEEMSEQLAASLGNHNYFYATETVRGYLLGKIRWPQMPKEDNIEIASEAFESVLTKKRQQDKIESVKHELSEAIEKVYSDYLTEVGKNAAATAAASYLIDIVYSDELLFIQKHLAACSSLTRNDIAFLNCISPLPPDEKKALFKKWCGRATPYDGETLFEIITSQAFCQWVELRNKNYLDASRKSAKKKAEKTRLLSADTVKQIDKMTEEQAACLLTVAERLKARDDKKYPLASPEEIDLLLLFKYFLSEKQQAATMEEAEIIQKKTAGD